MFRESEIVVKAIKSAEDTLYNNNSVGGYVRYENDNYWRSSDNISGNPWMTTTLWMTHYYLYNDEQLKARNFIDWVIERAMPTGVLPEQLHSESGEFAGVAPFNWSHAELVNTLILYKTLGL